MNYWLGSLFQRNAHSLARRLYFALLPRLKAVFSKRQSVHFVRINGTSYKRVVLGDSREAELVENALDRAPPQAAFPSLIHRHENELLMSFVDGRPFDPSNPDDRAGLAQFLGALYATPRTAEPTEKLRKRFDIDAAFLRSAGLIDDRLRVALQRKADMVQPAEVEFGLDYTDPVAKNFVIAEGRLFAIDVEALSEYAPTGTAIAKAGVHWLARDERSAFLDAVERNSGDVIRPQFDFVELCFRTAWTKRKLLDGRHHSIRVELLEELVESPASAN